MKRHLSHFALLAAVAAHAGQPSSANYSLIAETVDGGGASAGSASYSLVAGSLEPASSGSSTSSSYSLQHGFISAEVMAVAVLIEGQWVFYNHSAWDGDDAAANTTDDAAIAPDKSALLPGGVATLANYTGYSRGLNGVMVDIPGLPGTPTVADFSFRTGNDNDPGGWDAAPDPVSVTIRTGEGIGSSDRITLIWADNNLDGLVDANEAVAGAWLQVTVKATADTGLAADEVFYFGNATGEAGNSASDAVVDTSDVLAPFNNQTPAGAATLDSLLDFNRDKVVDTSDVMLPFNHQTGAGTALVLLDLSGGGAGASSSLIVQAMSADQFSAMLRGELVVVPPSPILAPVVIVPTTDPNWLLIEAPVDGQAWQLQSSAGLSGWSVEDLVPESDGTVWRWWIPVSPDHACRFYRVVDSGTSF